MRLLFKAKSLLTPAKRATPSLRSHSPKPGGSDQAHRGAGAVLERYMAALAPRLCFPGRHLAAEGDREPRAAEAPSAALFPALGGGPTTCSGGLVAAMFLSVNWRPRFAYPSLLRY